MGTWVFFFEYHHKIHYVKKRYGEAVVVFDGYSSMSTKDMTHIRRSKAKKGITVSFTLEMNLTVSKDMFLNDSANKQRFINFLGENLELCDCKVFHASSDAD